MSPLTYCAYQQGQTLRHSIHTFASFLKARGVRRVGWMFTFATAVYNLVRIRNLVEAVG